MKNLTAQQQELFQAMLGGVKCHYMPYQGRFNPQPYYFRNDTMKRCTAAAKALLRRGLVELSNEKFDRHQLVAVQKPYVPNPTL